MLWWSDKKIEAKHGKCRVSSRYSGVGVGKSVEIECM